MAPKSLNTINRYRWLIFWVLAGGYVLVYFHRLCTTVVSLDMMHDLNAGGALLGFLAAAYFYPYAVMQLPAGLLSDSWGPRRSITVFFLVAFVGSIVLGFSPNMTVAIIGRTLVGIGVSMLFVPTMKILAEWFREQEFSFMTGMLMAMGGVGSLTAATPLALLSNAVGWRASFILVGCFTLVLALLVWRYVKDRPEDMGWSSPEKKPEIDIPKISLRAGVVRVLSQPFFWPVAIWFFFNCAVFFTFIGIWAGPYMMQIYGLTKTQTGYILIMPAVGLVLGGPLLSRLSDRVFKGRKPVLITSSVISLLLTAALTFYTAQLNVPLLYLICLGLGIFGNAVVVIGFTTTKELFPVQIAGTSTGLVNLFPFAGAAVFQPVLGYMLEQSGRVNDAFTVAGYQRAFFVLFLCAAAALLASLFTKETLS